MGKILVVEDDVKLLKILKIQLEHENHEVSLETDGIEAVNKIDKNRDYFDLMLLDLTLPGMEGDKVCKQVRKISEIPIIVLSARSSVEEKVNLLKLGANDYMTKPFDMLELNARIDVNIRKNKISELFYKSLSINTKNFTVHLDGKQILLSKTEYELLKLFMTKTEEIITREEIVEKVWRWEASDNLIDSTMKKIRQKIGKEKIKTVRGIGYILKYD
jgi:two component transcriptional regulator, winged helix family